MRDFVHLHLHTQYSLLDGAIKIKDLAERAQAYGYRAVAITDHGNLFGLLEFYKTLKEKGIKPLLGMEAYFTTGSRFDRKGKGSDDNLTDRINHHIILIAKDQEGLKNLFRLSSLSYREGFYYKPRIDYELLQKYHRGLIAVTACLKGVPTYYASMGEERKAEEWVKKLKDLFGDDLYLELQANGLPEQETANRVLINIAKRFGVKLVATADAHYLDPEDKTAHSVLMALQMKKTLQDIQKEGLKYSVCDLHFAPPQEMWERFRGKFDGWEDALKNTLEVAEKCADSFPQLENKDYLLPKAYEGVEEGQLLEDLAREGLRRRQALGHCPDSKEYWDRLEYEIEQVRRMGFAGYFLIVQDFINWAKNQGVPVGPGRGSAAGSLLAYALGITDVDPVKHGLLFERFLNPERISMPDVDVDFCMEGREKVIQYVREKYGEDKVAQIITYNVMKAKQALRDAARALGLPYSVGDRLAKLVPPGDVQGSWLSLEEMVHTPLEELLEKYGHHRTDIEENVKTFRQLMETDAEIRRVVEIALKLEGLVRHTSLHAAGIVISPLPLEEVVPTYYDDGQVATQLDMGQLEKLGLVKMDFLGLKTLTELNAMRNLIRERHKADVDFLKIPLDDERTFELLRKGNTSGVFQLESKGMQRLLSKLSPDRFEDLVAAIALYRPGPLKSGLVDSYVKRKHGKEEVEYPFPELEPVLKETYGVWVYQEQIMKASQILAGFTPGEADTLRKAIGKKDKELMASLREKFIRGAVERGYKEEKITKLWEDFEKFASYSFNKSHSVAYGYLSYWTAYLKAHYTEEFFAVKLSYEKNDAKFLALVNDAKKHRITILPPDINKSHVHFVIEGDRTLRFGLARIKGIGEDTAYQIVKARKTTWTQPSQVARAAGLNKKALEALIKAGAFDFTGKSRTALLKALESKNALLGGVSLFEKNSQSTEDRQEDIFHYEKEVLGFYLTRHPIDVWEGFLEDTCKKLEEVEELEGGPYLFAGSLTDIKVKKTTKNTLMATAHLTDRTGMVPLIIPPSVYEEEKDKLKEDSVVVIEGLVERDEETEEVSIIARAVHGVEEFLKRKGHYITLIFTCELEEDKLLQVHRTLTAYTGPDGLPITIEIITPRYRTLLEVDPRIRVVPTPELREALRSLGVEIRV